MTGETNLRQILATLAPRLMDGEYVFASFSHANYGDHADLNPIASMMEPEGLTLVIPKQRADDRDVTYDAVFCGITLDVHSSLEAIGLTAAFAEKLTMNGISANVIAGFYHDHIFVPTRCKEAAMLALQSLAGDSLQSSE